MLTQILSELYQRDLSRLKAEIEAYPTEESLWVTGGDIINPAGNLCLHMVGNLRHFFGSVLNGSGYVRDRDAEFSTKGVSRADLLAGVDAAVADIEATLANLSDEDLEKTYPLEVFGSPMTTGFFLTHLATHLNWHLGHVNYHRRLLAASGS